MQREKRGIDVQPIMLPSWGRFFCRFLQVYEIKTGPLVISPMAMSKLVADTQAVFQCPEHLTVFALKSRLREHGAHKCVGGLNSAGYRSQAIKCLMLIRLPHTNAETY